VTYWLGVLHQADGRAQVVHGIDELLAARLREVTQWYALYLNATPAPQAAAELTKAAVGAGENDVAFPQ